MQQDIRFCKTSDGVRIAYSIMGSGPPLLVSSGWVSHLELELAAPPRRMRLEALASHFTVIRYDKRGVGLSDRNVNDLSVDARLPDIEAVVEDAGLDRFFLQGISEGGPLAIKYSALHPERVIRLALLGTFADGSRLPRSKESGEALAALVRAEWGLGSETLTSMFIPGATQEERDGFKRLQRAGATGDVAADIMLADYNTDVRNYLEKVQAPTLVIHSRGDRAVRFELGREIAAGIPKARLFPLESNRHVPEPELMQLSVREMVRFFLEGIGESPPPDQPAYPAASIAESQPERRTRGTATIMFLDIADSTGLTEALGDDAFRSRSRALESEMRRTIEAHGGRAIAGRVLGDGILALFSSASEGIECALACRSTAGEHGLSLHLGLHAGDVIEEGNNVYGGAVNLASRVANASAPDEILVSDTIRNLARTSAGVTFEDRGLHALKGIDEPQRLYAVAAGA
jgi:class 3 adenylate cyclase/pimeloyl-ACP methyl ester carboxylesterase